MGLARRTGVPVVLALAALLVGLGSASARGGYVITDLGLLPGGGQSMGMAINGKGIVAGWATTDKGYANAVHSVKTTLTDLGTLGGRQSWGYGIDTAGEVVGTSEIPNPGHPGQYLDHAFVTGPGGVGMKDLGTLKGMTSSEAFGVNPLGQITGDSGSGLVTHAFRTDATGTLTDLGTLPGASYSRGNAINQYGDVAGTARTSWGSFHAIRYTDTGGMKDLGTLPWGTTSYGLAINRWDQVAGRADDASGDFHAFYTNGRGKMVDIGALPGGTSSVALGINDSGVVVGSSDVAVDGQIATHGFLYSPKKGLVDLNSLINPKLGWDILQASAINDPGQITGIGVIGGQTHAFVMSVSTFKYGYAPTPEPAAWVLLAVGGVGLAAWRGWVMRRAG